jgi:poly-gamma-glutamate synthesis protein (capsule biosynthesis protein)
VLKQQDPQCFIIVSLHWGGEHTLKPIPLQRQQAHDLIDAGADALICHHTHTLQTIEQYQGKPIYYSIGNFIFDQHKPLNTRACMVKVAVTRDDASFETIPITINNCIPNKLKIEN